MESQQEMGKTGCFREVKCIALPQLDLRQPVSAGRNSNDTYRQTTGKCTQADKARCMNFSLTYKHTKIHTHLFPA